MTANKYSARADVEDIRAKHPNDHYVTPVSMAYAAMTWLKDYVETTPLRYISDRPLYILDAGHGDYGPFGYVCRKIWPEAHITGIDIRETPDMTHENHGYTRQIRGNLLNWRQTDLRGRCFDLIVGNPPFSEREPWILAARQLLHPIGYLNQLLPTDFQHGNDRSDYFYNSADREFNIRPLTIVAPGLRPGWQRYDYTLPVRKRNRTNSRNYAFYTWGALKSQVNTETAWRSVSWNHDPDLEERFCRANGIWGKLNDPTCIINEDETDLEEMSGGPTNGVVVGGQIYKYVRQGKFTLEGGHGTVETG